MNPRLWRDHSYSLPGFPRPTINHMSDFRFQISDFRLFVATGRDQSSIYNLQSSTLTTLIFLLALANDFWLGWLFTFDCRSSFSFFLHHADGRNHDIRILKEFNSLFDFQIRNVQNVVNIEI